MTLQTTEYKETVVVALLVLKIVMWLSINLRPVCHYLWENNIFFNTRLQKSLNEPTLKNVYIVWNMFCICKVIIGVLQNHRHLIMHIIYLKHLIQLLRKPNNVAFFRCLNFWAVFHYTWWVPFSPLQTTFRAGWKNHVLNRMTVLRNWLIWNTN